MPIVEVVGSNPRFKFKIGHCRPAETERERERQQQQVQKGLSGYLTGGTRKVPGISGTEKVAFILRRIKSLKIKGRERLMDNLGSIRVKEAERKAKADFVNKWLSLAKARGIKVSVKDLRKLPETVRKEAKISVAESELLFTRKGFGRWLQTDGRRIWRDSEGRFSKGPK